MAFTINDLRKIFSIDQDGARVAKFGVLNAEDVYPEPFPFTNPNVMATTNMFAVENGGSGDTVNIQKIAISSPVTTTDVGEVTLEATNGYKSSFSDGSNGYFYGNAPNLVLKFPFAISSGSASSIGSISPTYPFTGSAGIGFSSDDYAYAYGGHSNGIMRFPFAQPAATAVDVGEAPGIATNKGNCTYGISSKAFGFGFGNTPEPAFRPVSTFAANVYKFPFSIPIASATDVSETGQADDGIGANISLNRGFQVSGIYGPQATSIISFPLASPAPATDTGELSVGRMRGGSGNGTSDGYYLGGQVSATSVQPAIDTIISFPFAISSGTGTGGDVGELLSATKNVASSAD